MSFQNLIINPAKKRIFLKNRLYKIEVRFKMPKIRSRFKLHFKLRFHSSEERFKVGLKYNFMISLKKISFIKVNFSEKGC